MNKIIKWLCGVQLSVVLFILSSVALLSRHDVLGIWLFMVGVGVAFLEGANKNKISD